MKGSKGKKGLITKTWERCKSIGRGHKSSSSSSSSYNENIGSLSFTTRSRSWHNLDITTLYSEEKKKEKGGNKKKKVTPEGCFSVYVGPQMQRFVIKAEYANHPLFKILLEEAESEYGYSSQGPLVLPCKVEVFYKVLAEMDYEGSGGEEKSQGCASFKRSPRSYQLLSPNSRMIAINHKV
ncbi:hypothetical protein RIF29_13853 [Crotalaria pallida]|uniref:Uncharacterized protein n=1 Tax=Crotalaria pallida TaxID=3830 RepID=A0AAN9I9S5_CROPI